MKRLLPMVLLAAASSLTSFSASAATSDWWVFRNAQCEPAAYTPDELVKIKLSTVLLDQPADGWKVLAGKDEPDSLIYFGHGKASCEALGKALSSGQLHLQHH
ncbi:hypothetical protein [Parathalassolituus penaei]|uniref:Uncharacterized protein n=1 Tax=Parathalassolituus penaei TaxID=2997323 RepID=A0A9X3ITV7_9GAMM|nr:hypothetical protein [Parathalassolituus penaei]MCY0966294.1 hypothetical protein [Parathalassolituus penaei]